MNDSDKDRILNFLLGNESISEFEHWLYNTSDLESRIGNELYFDLIDFNYQSNDIIHRLKKTIIDKYITNEEFKTFKYYSILKKAGWLEGRKIEVKKTGFPETINVKHAIKIIEEFGGLSFPSINEVDYWIPSSVDFSESLSIEDMSEYGVNKNLICFASADDLNVNLYVDESNKFYQLDNIASVNLYEYKGYNFEEMMRSLLGIEDNIDNFRIIGRKYQEP